MRPTMPPRSSRQLRLLGLAGIATVAMAACSTSYQRALGSPERPPPIFRSVTGEAAYVEAYGQFLEHWPVRPRSVFVPTRFGPTHVLVSGQEHNPPVLLLHAVSVSSAAWYLNAPALSEHFRVYAVDGIGDCGLSRMTSVPRDLHDYGEWLADVFTGLRLETAPIVGHSYGGFLAVNFGLRHPERVERLVLLAPAATVQPIRPFLRFMLRHPNAIPFFRPSAERTLKMQAHPGFEPDPVLVRMMETVARACRVTTIFPHVYNAEQLAAIQAPTLLLLGDREQLYDPRRAMARADRHIPRLESVLISNAGHTLNLERPDDVNTAILRFLLRPQAARPGRSAGCRRRRQQPPGRLRYQRRTWVSRFSGW
jgi:pimeloyl-ACP methyl ester carboxylesterase